MNKGILFLILSVVCVMAALAMYQVGSHSTHMSELKGYCFVPLPLALVSLIAGILHLQRSRE